jgi:type VI secretion system secreted protein Hcp
VAVDFFMVIPTQATGGPNPAPLASEPVQDAYFSQTFAKAAAVVQLRNFSLSAENPTTVASATGTGGGKVKFDPLQVEKAVDRLSPSLLVVSASGAHFPTVQIYVRKTGGAQAGKPYLAYEFSMVFVSELQWSGESGDEAPVEQVTFAYGALTVGYYPQQPDGSLGKITKLGWSQVTNTSTGAEALSGF